MPGITAFDFYREVLLTYRLIFGQEQKSAKAWKRYCNADIHSHDTTDTNDPLLPILCGKHCKNEATYANIEAPEIGQQYSARADFPFFGERLVKVQQFVLKKNPSNWKSLWNDRRDLREFLILLQGFGSEYLLTTIVRFYTFWAVVWVGGISLFLSLLQNIESAIQIAYAAKPPKR
jgi:hypothetical protein